MSDSEKIEVTVSNQTVIIYNNRKPDCYSYSDIFDPDHPESGKVFPSLNSLVIKDGGSLWYVSDRNTDTFKVTLKPCCFVETIDDAVQIISYGNDKFCLYMDNRTNPFKLVVDAKLLFYGNNLVEYALYRTATDGEEECISMYIDSTGKFISNRIPLASISEEYRSYKFPTNCHTTHELIEGEPIILRVFNNFGNLAAEITIYVRNSIWWNDLNSHTNPILKLDATCLQMRGDDFFIYEKQDPSHLNIQPYLQYADGTTLNIPIDNVQCFLHGLEYFIPSYPGYSQSLIIKYFLNHRETAIGFTSQDEKRFLCCQKKLVVLKNENDYSAKISVIPVYDKTNAIWKLRFFAYTDRRDAVYDITDITLIDEEYPFDGEYTSWGKEQHVRFSYDLQNIFHTDDPVPGVQDIWITMWDPINSYVRYTFRDSDTSTHVYGVDGSVTRRPVIWYDDTIDQYFIPTSIFRNWDAILESFYHLASPPVDKRVETKAPDPTHFLIRDAYNGQMLIGGSIPKESYAQAWSCISGTPVLKGQTVVVEFVQEINGEFKLLYGVPVDIDKNNHLFNDATLHPAYIQP